MAVRSRPRPVQVKSLQDLFTFVAKDRPSEGRVHAYRGHPDRTYVLRPSLFRKKEYRRDEKNILRELISIQPSEFQNDRTMFEQLVRMQHYSLPTRLLDITFNPLVALYFTCSLHPETHGEFLRFSLAKSSIKYFDSDTVSCLANLSNLTGRQRDNIRHFQTSDELNSSDVGERLLHFIQSEKPYFLPRIEIDHLKGIIMVKPKQTNRRILAQQGAFLLFGLKSLLRDANDFNIFVTRVRVPASSKGKILQELDGININASTLFPEIESAAKYIMSKITPVQEEFEQVDE